jgi:hypothetical protein
MVHELIFIENALQQPLFTSPNSSLSHSNSAGDTQGALREPLLSDKGVREEQALNIIYPLTEEEAALKAKKVRLLIEDIYLN